MVARRLKIDAFSRRTASRDAPARPLSFRLPHVTDVRTHIDSARLRVSGLMGRGLPISIGVIVVISLVAATLAFVFLSAAPPTTLTLASGPEGSSFRLTADRYAKILAREGVTLKIVTSQGSRDNLARLADAKAGVDVGFIVGGEAVGKPKPTRHLVSLGSVSYQPLMIFYRGKPEGAVVGLQAGQRLDIGLEGSGASALAQTLLEANGIKPGDGTQVGHARPRQSVKALLDGKIDALFAMSDSTPTALMRQLLRDHDIHLFNFVQAEGYTHRITYLNKLVLPRGAIDFGEDIPAKDVVAGRARRSNWSRATACIRRCPTCCWRPRARCTGAPACTRRAASFPRRSSTTSPSAPTPPATTPRAAASSTARSRSGSPA